MIRLMIAVVLGFLRVVGHKSPAYQAIAHMYVGAMFAHYKDRWSLILAIALTVLEAACFFMLRNQ